jgi:hypothetical protein
MGHDITLGGLELVVLVDMLVTWHVFMEEDLCTLNTRPLKAKRISQKAQQLCLYVKMSPLGHGVTPKREFYFCKIEF